MAIRQTDRTDWTTDTQTDRKKDATVKHPGTDIHRTPTDSKTGKHRHMQTSGGRQKDEQKRQEGQGQTAHREARTDRYGETGTRTDRHTKMGTGTDKGH
ncbi:hypothetical protein V3C99_000356, partial [Haemonchus contortus]